MAGTALASADSLRRRLHRILSGPEPKSLSWPGWLILVVLVPVVLALSPDYRTRRSYSAMNLGSLGGGQTWPIRLSERGHVLGYSSLGCEPRERGTNAGQHVFRTAPGRPINSGTDDLNVLLGAKRDLPGRTISAIGINQAGEALVHVNLARELNRRINSAKLDRTYCVDGSRIIELDNFTNPRSFKLDDAGLAGNSADVLEAPRRPPIGSQRGIRTNASKPRATLVQIQGQRALPIQPLDVARFDVDFATSSVDPRQTRGSLVLARVTAGNVYRQLVGELRSFCRTGHPIGASSNQPIDAARNEQRSSEIPIDSVKLIPYDTWLSDRAMAGIRRLLSRPGFVDECAQALGDAGDGGPSGLRDLVERRSFRAFRSKPDRPIDPASDDLGTLGGNDSYAFGVNNHGDVVGSSQTPNREFHAFVYADGAMTDLNDCVELDHGWVLQYAGDINDRGQIVTAAINVRDTIGILERGYLLTPAPQPEALVLLALGIAITGSGLVIKVWRNGKEVFRRVWEVCRTGRAHGPSAVSSDLR